MKQHWLETLYRKEEPFGRVLLFSVMRKMTLLLHCHAVCRGAKRIASHGAHVRAAGNDERYIAPHGRYERWGRMGGTALLMRHFECGRDELCVVLFWNLIFNYSAREEVGNHANIEIVVSELETGDITNPSLVRPLGTGLLPKNVFLALWLTHFQIFLLRCRSNTVEFISRMSRAIYAALT